MPNVAPLTTKGTDGVNHTRNAANPLADSIISKGFADGEAASARKFLGSMQTQNAQFTDLAQRVSEAGAAWTAATANAVQAFLEAYMGQEAAVHVITEGKINAVIADSVERAGEISRDTPSVLPTAEAK